MASTIRTITAIVALSWLTTITHAQKNILVISDIHLDETKDQSAIPQNARNAGIDTWDTAQREIQHLLNTQSPKFIVYLGDLPLHVPPSATSTSLRTSFCQWQRRSSTAMTNAGETLKALRNIAQKDHIPLIFVPGNNDSPDSDYGKFSPALFQYDTTGAGSWPVINAHAIPTSQYLYSEIGCYAAYPLGRKARLRIIVLNTVLYTWNYRSADHSAECKKQLTWLGRQLQETKSNRETALILMHVPPGIDVYKHNTFWTSKVLVNETTIQNNFLDTLARYRENIMGLLSSHTHMDGFKRLYDKDGNFITLLISAPAVVPSAFNNTAVKLIQYNKKRQFTGSVTRYHAGTSWQTNTINIPGHKPLNPWFAQMDSTSLFHMVDTLYNTGVKTHNKDLDLDIHRN